MEGQEVWRGRKGENIEELRRREKHGKEEKGEEARREREG